MNGYGNQKKADVCLVVPPVSRTTFPAIGPGILKSVLIRDGISCHIDHADMHFLHSVGVDNIDGILDAGMDTFFGEYIFAEAAGIRPQYGDDEILDYLKATRKPLRVYDQFGLINKCRNIAFETVEKTVDRVLAYDPKVVGVTSCFQQKNAAIAILKRIKEIRPDIITLMGGANCFGSAGLAILKKFSFVDYVFFGESDDIFSDVIKGAMERYDGPLPYGVLRNGDPLPNEAPHRVVTNLDKIPYPNYDDYFEVYKTDSGFDLMDIFRSEKLDFSQPLILLESSRGCWWGQNEPCTFCALDSGIHCYRKKSSRRFIDELIFITEKYGIKNVVLTDLVMSPSLPEELIRYETFKRYGIQIFVETRTNMPAKIIKKMKEAGIVMTQPGIESLSDHLLKIMNKGTTMLDNLRYMRECEANGIRYSWNIIHGFPQETKEDYEISMELIPFIEHFNPPMSCADFIFQKNCTYDRHPEKYDIKLVPKNYYKYICPDDEKYISEAALNLEPVNEYLFPKQKEYAEALYKIIKKWWKYQKEAPNNTIRLETASFDGRAVVIDTRSCRKERLTFLPDILADVLNACDEPKTAETLTEMFKDRYSVYEVANAIRMLYYRRFIFRQNNLFFSVVVRKKPEELIRGEASEFTFLLTSSADERSLFEQCFSENTNKEKSYKDRIKDAVTCLAEKKEMYLTGEQYFVLYKK